jgi:hypothetical protein
MHQVITRAGELIDVTDVLPRLGENDVAIEIVKSALGVPGRGNGLGAFERLRGEEVRR